MLRPGPEASFQATLGNSRRPHVLGDVRCRLPIRARPIPRDPITQVLGRHAGATVNCRQERVGRWIVLVISRNESCNAKGKCFCLHR